MMNRPPYLLGCEMDGTARAGRPRVVVLGAGFAGYHCLRRLERLLPADTAEIIAVSPADYMLYIPLLPDVTAGVLAPRRVAVPLRTHLPRTRLMLGTATNLNLDERTCSVADVEGRPRVVRYDRLVITCGSVTRLLAVPGVAEHAMGFKSVAEVLYLRDHILRQLELAEQCDDDDERAARLTFVVVEAGYTGTEVAAQGALLTQPSGHCVTGRSYAAIGPAGCCWTWPPGCCRGWMPGCPVRPPRCCTGGCRHPARADRERGDR